MNTMAKLLEAARYEAQRAGGSGPNKEKQCRRQI